MKRLSILISCMVFWLIASATPIVKAADINVPGDYFTIQEAIDAAGDGDVVIVDPGTYYENINFLGKGITVRSMDPDDPNLVAATIIDGNQIDSVVTFHSKEDSNSLLSGVTVRNGNTDEGGGGIRCYESSPTINNCIISINYSYRGGGIFCHESSPIINNCIISENSGGEGIWCYDSSLNINNCTINNNKGAGIHCTGSSPCINECLIVGNGNSGIYCEGSPPHSHFKISNCIITGNSTHKNGGGIRCWLASPNITECIISDNFAAAGGGICCTCSSPIISNCVITNNSAQNKGGGICCWGGWVDDRLIRTTPDITNCIISRNSAELGGGIYCPGMVAFLFYYMLPNPRIINCTIVQNTASDSGGGIFSDLNFSGLSYESSISGGGIFRFISEPNISSCIIWGNAPDQVSGKRLRIAYSDVQDGGYFGRRNINIGPLFVDPNAGDYHLQPDSPCINKGIGGCEMGAYGNRISYQRRIIYGRRTTRKY